MTRRIRKAVFPVGGLGTRFLPATKAMPKEMLPVVDKPLIQYAVEEALAAGIEDFIFVTGRAKQAIEDHFDVSFELEHTLRQRGNETMLKIVRGVRSPAFGVNFDSGNFRDGPDPYAELALIAPYTVSAQIKVEVQRNRKSEPADLGKKIGILRGVGYSGWIVLEYEAKADPYEQIPKYVAELREILGDG